MRRTLARITRTLVSSTLATFPMFAHGVGTVYTDPNCPTPTDPVSIRATGNVPMLWADPFAVTVGGSTIRVETNGGSSFDFGQTSFVNARIGKLPAGDYQIEVYVRDLTSPPTAPEVLLATAGVQVREAPTGCPLYLNLLLQNAPATVVEEGDLAALEFRVTAQGGVPVAGATLHGGFSYVVPGEETHATMVYLGDGIAGDDGTYRFPGGIIARGDPGFVSGYAYVTSSSRVIKAPYALVVRSPIPNLPPVTPVVEYFLPSLGHYFITSNPAEMSQIDLGLFGKWERTYIGFAAKKPSAVGDGDLPVCRFYGTPGKGPNSHFYIADPVECAAVKHDPGWMYEGIAFYAQLPQAGACPPTTQPVYRAYNNGFVRNDSNHRYTTHPAILQPLAAQGWTVEGIVMCAPV